MRDKIRQLLIRLANFIGKKDFYDFGEPIIAMQVFKDTLTIYTKSSVYSFNGKKWTKLVVGESF